MSRVHRWGVLVLGAFGASMLAGCSPPSDDEPGCAVAARAFVEVADGKVMLTETSGDGLFETRDPCEGAPLSVRLDNLDASALSEYVYGVKSLVKDGALCSFEGVSSHESEVSRCVLATVSEKNRVYEALVEEVKSQVPDAVVWDGELTPGESGMVQYYVMPEVAPVNGK